MSDIGAQQTTAKRDRLLLGGTLAATGLVAWAYLLYQAQSVSNTSMDAMADMAMPAMHGWTFVDLLLLFMMWALMMLAMMVPAATPMILLVAHVSRERKSDCPVSRALLFTAGYFFAWGGFSVVATLVQWRLHEAALLSPMMRTTPFVGGALLIGAGAFQWTALKQKCLVHCRSPLAFLINYWRESPMGALAMGARHGWYCVGCCWMLMALLFVAGVMNLLWVAALTAFIIVERLVVKGDVVGRIVGLTLMIAGAVLILR